MSLKCFDDGSAALKRYRLNEIRGYIATVRNRGGDTTAEAVEPNPGPEQL